MKLIILFGAAAVGKMTVGQELCKITPLRLFHNHMTIEPVLEVFGEFHAQAIRRLRDVFFEEFAATDNYGMVFTFMWDFDDPEDWAGVAGIADIFKRRGAEIYYVELVADQQIRLERNKTENRLAHKPSKRDLVASEARVLAEDAKHRLASRPGELPFENYLRIDNTHLSPEAAAQQIKAHFGFADPAQ
ncbi:MAG: shikimate kinase [Oscillospiraceae bacterium]|nr:shikimate kinase [Oscillospiraceae bacterium]